MFSISTLLNFRSVTQFEFLLAQTLLGYGVKREVSLCADIIAPLHDAMILLKPLSEKQRRELASHSLMHLKKVDMTTEYDET